MDGWQAQAQQMADRLVTGGDLTSERWRKSFAAVPRHHFVPRFFLPDPQGGWRAVETGDAGYLETVYQSGSLVTQLDGDPSSWQETRDAGEFLGGWPSSSSSDPGLMSLMIEAIDAQPGEAFCEVGFGTGYNLAVLSEGVGDADLWSVDVDMALVERGIPRLAALGYQPTVLAMDAEKELPPQQFARIEATVALRRVPAHWLTHVKPGGRILVSLASGLISDALFLLHISDDGAAQGMAQAKPGNFMTTRAGHLQAAYELVKGIDTSAGLPRSTKTPFAVVNDYESGFPTLLSLRMQNVQRYLTGDGQDWNWLVADDLSWVRSDEPGSITAEGPRDLWAEVERLWCAWNELGSPTRERIGLTVTRQGAHAVWVDEPANILFSDDD